MAADTTAGSDPASDRTELMASVDEDETGKRLVIADVSTDEAWLSMRVPARTSLSAWR